MRRTSTPARAERGERRPSALLVLPVAVVMIFVALGAQALRMQVLDPAVPAAAREGVARILPIDAPRGLITDRNGTVLARNVPRYRVALVPGELPPDGDARHDALTRIAEVTRVPHADLEAAASTHLAIVDPFAPATVRDGVTAEDAIVIRAALAGLGGVRVEASPARMYEPSGALGHILGYVGVLPADRAAELVGAGYSLDSRMGLAGVETQYEEALRGTPGRRLVLAHPTGRVLRELSAEPPTPGGNVVLSIDMTLQRAAEAALQRGIDKGLAVVRRNTGQQRAPLVPSGAAVVLDVRTGEVLAMVSLPSFDANIFGDAASAAGSDAIAALFADAARPLVDRSYMEVRSPGSIFKPLVALAALEENIATTATRIQANGAISVRSEYDPSVFYTFKDWAVHGNIDLTQAIARSSDVYFYLLAGGYRDGGRETFRGLGADRIATWARAAGLGKATGLDLPGEAGGLVPDPAWKLSATGDEWLLGDTYTYGIGQGYLTTTPLQMAVLAAALANGGDVLVPHVVRGIEVGGTLTPIETRIASHLPASPRHLADVQRGMAAAAAPDGTAATGVPAGVRIGGKTGTAEFGQPYPDGEFDTHGWYMGFAPYDRPEIAVAVYLEYGVGQTYAGPVAREILTAYFARTESAATNRVAR